MGTYAVINLCRGLKHLEAFIHISTAYSNPYLKTKVEEVFYPTKNLDGLKLAELMATIGEIKFDAVGGEMMDGFPNPYCFTKNLAEDLVHKWADGLPVAVFRPSLSE